MKIKAIRAYGKQLGLSRPYSIAYKTVEDVTCVFVELELENGLIGLGAANPSKQVVYESVEESIERLTTTSFESLVGLDIEEYFFITGKLKDDWLDYPGSHAALDIAVYDAYTQLLKIPLSKFFGRRHACLPTSVTIGIKNVQETLEEAKEYYDRSFKILKVKTGLDPEEDAERVIRIKENYPSLLVRVDANQGYTPDQLQKFVDLTMAVELELIEQPFPVERFTTDMKMVNDATASLIAADESIKNPTDALHLVQNAPNCPVYNIKLMKCGGITNAMDIATIAHYAEKDLMWGCNDESIVSISAALNLALSYKHTKYIDLDGSLDIAQDHVSGGFELKDGCMYPLEKPGLGVEKLV